MDMMRSPWEMNQSSFNIVSTARHQILRRFDHLLAGFLEGRNQMQNGGKVSINHLPPEIMTVIVGSSLGPPTAGDGEVRKFHRLRESIFRSSPDSASEIAAERLAIFQPRLVRLNQLCEVSRYWMKVIKGSPALWATISSADPSPAAEMALNLSEGCPLKIFMGPPWPTDLSWSMEHIVDSHIATDFFNKVVKTSPRWEEVWLKPRACEFLLQLINLPTPLLKSINVDSDCRMAEVVECICCPSSTFSWSLFATYSQLRSLSFRGLTLKPDLSLLSNIVSLEILGDGFGEITLSSIAGILSGAHNVERLVLEVDDPDSDPPKQVDIIDASLGIQLPRLVSLSFTVQGLWFDDEGGMHGYDLLKALHIPACSRYSVSYESTFNHSHLAPHLRLLKSFMCGNDAILSLRLYDSKHNWYSSPNRYRGSLASLKLLMLSSDNAYYEVCHIKGGECLQDAFNFICDTVGLSTEDITIQCVIDWRWRNDMSDSPRSTTYYFFNECCDHIVKRIENITILHNGTEPGSLRALVQELQQIKELRCLQTLTVTPPVEGWDPTGSTSDEEDEEMEEDEETEDDEEMEDEGEMEGDEYE